MPVAPGALHDPPSARRKIVYDDRRLEVQVREVNNIYVGAIAGGNHSAVMEAISPSRRQCLLVDEELEWQLRAARPIARPNGEQAGRRTGIADKPNVGTAIGDAADRVAMEPDDRARAGARRRACVCRTSARGRRASSTGGTSTSRRRAPPCSTKTTSVSTIPEHHHAREWRQSDLSRTYRRRSAWKWQSGLSYMAAWTWAKNLTDVDEIGGVEGGTTLENAFDRRRERAELSTTPVTASYRR